MRLLFSREVNLSPPGYEIRARFSAYVARLDETGTEGQALAFLVRLSGRVEETKAPHPYSETVQLLDVRLLDGRDPSEASLLAVDEFRACEAGNGGSLIALYKAEKAEQAERIEAAKTQHK